MTKYAMLAAPLLIACAIGCGPTDTQMNLSDYDRNCVEDDDCVLAIEGSVCACDYETLGINRTSINSYRADYSLAIEACDGIAPCSDLPVVEAVCDEGICTSASTE